MRWAVIRILLVGVLTLALYALGIGLLDLIPGTDIRQPLPWWWAGAATIGWAYATWNFGDALLDVWDAIKRKRARRYVAGGLWRSRSDFLQGVACLCWAIAGVLAILQWSTPDVRTSFLLAGAASLVLNQGWNRIDRERISRMPSVISETRALERLLAARAVDGQAMERTAAALAADIRALGHDIDNRLSLPVGALEIQRARPGLPADEAATIDAGLAALSDYTEFVKRLHKHAKELDPSLHQPQERGA